MSASQYPQQIMSPHFSSSTYVGRRPGVIPGANSLVYPPSNESQFPTTYNNPNIMPQNMSNGYADNYRSAVNYSYSLNSGFPANHNFQVSSAAAMLPCYSNNNNNNNNSPDLFKTKTKSSDEVIPTTALASSTIVTTKKNSSINNKINNNEDDYQTANNNNNNNNNNNICVEIKSIVKTEQISINSEKDINLKSINASLTSPTAAAVSEGLRRKSSIGANSSISPSSQAGASLTNGQPTENNLEKNLSKNPPQDMSNLVITTSSSAATAAYASAIINVNNNSDIGNNSIAPCNILPSIDSAQPNSLNGFYSATGVYIPPGFPSDNLLPSNNTTVSTSLPPPYCWPPTVPQSSHSYNQIVGMHEYNSLTDDIYNAPNTRIPNSDLLAHTQSQIAFNGLTSTGSGTTVNGANYGTTGWPSQYYLPSDDKLPNVENCTQSQLNPYLGHSSEQSFYGSTSQLSMPNVDSFTPAATGAGPTSGTIGNSVLCNSITNNSNLNGVLPLDASNSDLYGGFQQHHLPQLHDSSTQFLDPTQQQNPPRSHELNNIYQQQILSQGSSVYSNLPMTESFNQETSNSTMVSGLTATKSNKPVVRRSRSTKTKTTVSSLPPNDVGSVTEQQQQQQQQQSSNYSVVDNSLIGEPSSSISNYSRSLSPVIGGIAPKMPRKSRSRAKDSEEDDGRSIEDKEAERRTANNTRERIRVRDINMAFKELAKLCSQHMPNTEERGLTKLGTLLKAVDLIPMLEEKVRQRNLDPRMACLKRNLTTDSSQL